MLSQELQGTLKLFDEGEFVMFKWRLEREWQIEFVSQNVKMLTGYESGGIHSWAYRLLESDP